MSVGSAVNHVGVEPAANSEASWLMAASELVAASARSEEGMAGSRTDSAEMLANMVKSLLTTWVSLCDLQVLGRRCGALGRCHSSCRGDGEEER